jgi:dTDP-D-glucose 4,6-dehydratase
VTDFPGNETVYLDITDVDAVRAAVAEYDIDVIVNCAAYTNVDKAETDVDTCRLLNAKSPENLAVAVREKGGILIHVSTDYVFGGEVYDSPLTEQTPTSPTGIYGLTKLEGEELIKFTLAAYNAGEGRIIDCRNLAASRELDSTRWEEIVKVIPLMREDSILDDESVKLGKFQGHETIAYVDHVFSHYSAFCEICPSI